MCIRDRELILYDAAARYLKELKDSGEAITPKAWQLEIEDVYKRQVPMWSLTRKAAS